MFFWYWSVQRGGAQNEMKKSESDGQGESGVNVRKR